MFTGTPDNTAALMAAIIQVAGKARNTTFTETVCGVDGSYGITKLPDLLDAMRPLLTEAGLALAQVPCNDDRGEAVLRGVLVHNSGASMQIDTPLNLEGLRGTAMQQFGAAMTYARRYQLSGLFFVSSFEDTDAKGDSVATPSVATPTKPPSLKKTAAAAAVSPTVLSRAEQLAKIATCKDIALLCAMKATGLEQPVSIAVDSRIIELVA